MQDEERRKSKRFNMQLSVEYRTLTQHPVSGAVTAENIGRGGMTLVSAENVQRGHRMNLRVDVPGSFLPIQAQARVAWSNGDKAGICLTKISHKDQERILEYIYKEWLKRQEQ